MNEMDIKEVIQVLKIMISYCKHNRDEIPALFKMLEIFNVRVSYDLNFISNFYEDYIHEEYSADQKRRIFKYYVKFMESD